MRLTAKRCSIPPIYSPTSTAWAHAYRMRRCGISKSGPSSAEVAPHLTSASSPRRTPGIGLPQKLDGQAYSVARCQYPGALCPHCRHATWISGHGELLPQPDQWGAHDGICLAVGYGSDPSHPECHRFRSAVAAAGLTRHREAFSDNGSGGASCRDVRGEI